MRKIIQYTALIAVVIRGAIAWDVGQAVNTTSGSVLGHASTRHREVSEYLGMHKDNPYLEH